MAQTTYEQYLQQFGPAATAQPTGMMQPKIAMPDVSAIQGAVQNMQAVNSAYQAPQRADLNQVREQFLAQKAADAQKQVQELLSAAPSQGGGMMSGGGVMSDAAFVNQMAYGIQNVQTLANMGLISQQTAQALINDAIAKAKAVDPQVLQTQPPAPVRSSSMNYYSGFSDGGDGYSGGFGSMSGAEGASIGAGGE